MAAGGVIHRCHQDPVVPLHFTTIITDPMLLPRVPWAHDKSEDQLTLVAQAKNHSVRWLDQSYVNPLSGFRQCKDKDKRQASSLLLERVVGTSDSSHTTQLRRSSWWLDAYGQLLLPCLSERGRYHIIITHWNPSHLLHGSRRYCLLKKKSRSMDGKAFHVFFFFLRITFSQVQPPSTKKKLLTIALDAHGNS
jgi:hypothetical protein